MTLQIRVATLDDEVHILHLYRKVAKKPGGLARTEQEITTQYIRHNLIQAQQSGIGLVVTHNLKQIVGEIHCYRLEPLVFQHVLSELTIAVDPEFQGQGIGKALFQTLLKHVEANFTDVFRVELIARESNIKAIRFYQQLGFVIEGKMRGRILNHHHQLEADVMMAWFNPSFLPNNPQLTVSQHNEAENR
ncbi:MAG: GNAT family N-acetyltransferase [Bacteroidetes Order II. Incertae sedis bacterium]|nr:GNAT family N-acetyltransferase [Bacteroidetes Order II. bacterium]